MRAENTKRALSSQPSLITQPHLSPKPVSSSPPTFCPLHPRRSCWDEKAPSYSTTRVVEALSCLWRTEAEPECFSALLIVSSGPPSFRALTVAAMVVTQHLPSSQSKPAKCLGKGSRKRVFPWVDRDTRTRQSTAVWQCTPSAKAATGFLRVRLSVHGHIVPSLSFVTPTSKSPGPGVVCVSAFWSAASPNHVQPLPASLPPCPVSATASISKPASSAEHGIGRSPALSRWA